MTVTYLLHAAESFLRASHEIPRILWNPNVYHRPQNSQTLDPALSESGPVHAPSSQFIGTVKVFRPQTITVRENKPQMSLQHSTKKYIKF